MLIKFSPNLSKQQIFAIDSEQTSIMGRDTVSEPILVHEFSDPVLVTDNYKIGTLPSTLRDTIFSLYASPVRVVEYDGVTTIILNYLVHQGKKHLIPGGVMLVGLSNLSEKIIFANQSEPDIKTVESLSVPMKINNVHNNPKWMEYLMSNGLDTNEHNGYQYWHTIKTFLISN